MKAVILNSGVGNRMGEFTEGMPKCLVPLHGRETILSRQINQLLESGIDDTLITTGPFKGMIQSYVEEHFPQVAARYVQNEAYLDTNYIYSLYLARDYLFDDVLLMHGDIVMSDGCLPALLGDAGKNRVIVDSRLPLPDKDFKAEVEGGYIHRIGIDLEGEDCMPLFPVYTLSRAFMGSWIKAIDEFIEQEKKTVYAETALNTILPSLQLVPYDLKAGFCREVDTRDDLEKVNNLIRETV
jgi:phosphoenolpyruvate phosphomutase